jgi:hypothetical protein
MSAEEPPHDALPSRADEVDASLLEWYGELSMIERLRAASRSAAWLERMRRAASRDR